MVSFSCEACGDVLTKKKLDPHSSRCRGASFTCIDCMVHFRGTEYRQHTSCMSEAQKYQGALYKEKNQANGKRNTAFNNKPAAAARHDHHSKQAYVEDDPEDSFPQPRATTTTTINALDFLVPSEISSPSRRSLGGTRAAMTMKAGAPPIFGAQPASALPLNRATSTSVTLNADELVSSSSDSSSESDDGTDSDSSDDETLGHKAGHVHVSRSADPNFSHAVTQILANGIATPMAISSTKLPNTETQRSAGSKRKRTPEVLDLSATYHTMPNLSEDTGVAELRDDSNNALVPITPHARLVHSGLTGGLQRMLSSDYPPSPLSVNSARQPSPLPTQRESPPVSRRIKAVKPGKVLKKRLQDTEHLRGRSEETPLGLGALMVPSRRKVRRASDESRPRKHVKHKVERLLAGNLAAHRSPREDSLNDQSVAVAQHRKGRGSDYAGDGAMVVYKGNDRAALFLSMVTKGPESLTGCSINKALKRYHRERRNDADGMGKHTGLKDSKLLDEKELWKSLRLRRNERGEVVVML